MLGLRPLLVPSRLDDPPQKIGFHDGKWLYAAGSGGAAEATDEAVYLAMSVRNVGSGIAVLHGWRFYPEWMLRDDHASLEEFTRLTRDIYIAAGDIGFWQGTFRDPGSPSSPPRRLPSTHESRSWSRSSTGTTTAVSAWSAASGSLPGTTAAILRPSPGTGTSIGQRRDNCQRERQAPRDAPGQSNANSQPRRCTARHSPRKSPR